jgi:hypothetical protein
VLRVELGEAIDVHRPELRRAFVVEAVRRAIHGSRAGENEPTSRRAGGEQIEGAGHIDGVRLQEAILAIRNIVEGSEVDDHLRLEVPDQFGDGSFVADVDPLEPEATTFGGSEPVLAEHHQICDANVRPLRQEPRQDTPDIARAAAHEGSPHPPSSIHNGALSSSPLLERLTAGDFLPARRGLEPGRSGGGEL